MYVDAMAENMRTRMLNMGDSVVKYSPVSLVGLLTLAVYSLVPLMVFFPVKDKEQMLNAVRRVLPRNRGLAGRCGMMNQQITNHIRGKVLRWWWWAATSLGFLLFGLNYSLLLAVPGGLFSVLILYRRLCGDNSGGGRRAVSVCPPGTESELFCRLSDYSGADGNLLALVLFSEAVNLHPLVIILVSGDFRRSVGFWGVFFAIPLATLIKAFRPCPPDGQGDRCLILSGLYKSCKA